jgi:hypothetical protein
MNSKMATKKNLAKDRLWYKETSLTSEFSLYTTVHSVLFKCPHNQFSNTMLTLIKVYAIHFNCVSFRCNFRLNE